MHLKFIWSALDTNLCVNWSCFSSQLKSRFPIGGEGVACRGSKLAESLGWTKLTNSLGKQQHELSTWMLLETTANLWASRHKATDFVVFSSFEFRGITKHCSWSCGKQWVLFILNLEVSLSFGETKLFPLGQSLSAYCYIARLSLNKMSIVIGWFLVTCPWSNSNVSWPG